MKKFSAEDPIISDLPEIDTVDQNTIEEGALQVKQVKDFCCIRNKSMDFSQVKADAELAVTEIENLNQVVGDVIGMKFKSHNSSSSDFCFIVVRVLGAFG